jgi:hypothetical protein
MNAQISKRTNHLRHFFAVALLSLAPLAAHAEVGISAGYTGMHDGGRGRVVMLDYVPTGSSWDFTAGNIGETTDRNTSFVVASYMIVDQHLWASFGPGLVTHQTSTLTSQYQFMTTFGYHHDDDWSVGVRHLSNGGLRGNNVGENLVFFSWIF